MSDDTPAEPSLSTLSTTEATDPPPSVGAPSRRWLTIPNLLCFARLAGSPVLVVLAASDRRFSVVLLFVLLALTDWLDGKLAVWLDQRSVYGARLDSAADVAMYLGITVAGLLLEGARLAGEWPWIAATVGSYGVAGVYGLSKLGRWPTYHTRTAKVSWLLMLGGIMVFLAGWSVWPMRFALVLVALGNLQSMAITRVLPVWRTDVISISAARRIRDQARVS